MKPIAYIDHVSGKPKLIDGYVVSTPYDIPLYITPQDQADRIAELEKDLALKTRDRDVFRDFTLAYEKRIEELEKHLKKVQWALAQHVDILGEMGWHQVNKDGYTTPQTKLLSEIEQSDAVCQEDDGCPTEMAVLKRFWRSHQTKPLSDEEIIELFENPDDFSCIEFARAIEKRILGK